MREEAEAEEEEEEAEAEEEEEEEEEDEGEKEEPEPRVQRVARRSWADCMSDDDDDGGASTASWGLPSHWSGITSPAVVGGGSRTPNSGGSVRSLHDKLSSPERLRKKSPLETKQDQDMRHWIAEVNRGRIDTARQLRLHAAGERARLVNDRKEQRVEEMREALRAKQTRADQYRR